MLDYLVAIGFGTIIFMIFMLVFLRRDGQGKRGGRLAGCQNHDPEKGCARCRDAQPAGILAEPTRPRED